MRDKCGWGEEINSGEEKRKRERRKEVRKETDGFFLQSTAFRQSESIGPRNKVRLCDEGYATRSMDSSYFGIFSTLRTMWLCFYPKGLFGQILE